MQRRLALMSCAFLLVMAASASVCAQRDRLSIEQFLDWEYVASPQISPDGKEIVLACRPDRISQRYE